MTASRSPKKRSEAFPRTGTSHEAEHGRCRLLERAAWTVIATTVLILPVIISTSGKEAFRVPKDLLFVGAGISLVALAAMRRILCHDSRYGTGFPRRIVILAAAAIGWSGLSTLFSVNRTLSFQSLLTAVAATVFFLGCYEALGKRPLSVLWLAVAPALLNAVLAVAQYSRAIAWPVAVADPQPRMRAIGLLGNPNDLGMLLVAPIIVLAALALTSKRARLLALSACVALGAGLLVTETLGALAAALAGLFVMGVFTRPRMTVAGAVIALGVFFAVMRASPARWALAQARFDAVARGDLDTVLSGRVAAFEAAWDMFVENPVLGVGLGCFRSQYFDHRTMTVMATAPLTHNEALTWSLNRVELNFSEVHNEHLQTLAEGGLPLYGVFVASLVVVAGPSLRKSGNDSRAELARRAALPLSCAIATLTLTAFPLRLAAPTATTLFLIAALLSWSEHGRA